MKKQFIFGGLLILFSVLSWVYFSRKPALKSIIPQKTIQSPQADTKEIESVSKSYLPSDTVSKKLDDYTKRAEELGKSYNRAIRYYGKIIDQDKKPIQGIDVRIRRQYFGVFNPGLAPSFKETIIASDADGRFSLEEGEGLSLSIQLLPKPGYEYKADGYGSVSFRDKGIGVPADVVSTYENPIIYYVYKKGHAEPLIVGEIFERCNPDGRTYTIDLKSKKISEGNSSGDFRISCKRPPGDFPKNYEWSFEMNAERSELLESKDPFLYLAPINGYQGNWKYMTNPSILGYRNDKYESFYIRNKKDSVYGRMELELMSAAGVDFAIRIKYWINPSGSRNLEYDPAKSLKWDKVQQKYVLP